MRVTAATLLLIASTALSPAFADDSSEPGVMTISGTGTIAAAPDMAIVTSGVVTDGDTARAALSANTEAMTALIETLKAAGIESRDIQTSGFSVQPNYVYSDKRDANGYQLPPKINGYRVSNNVTVKVRELEALGPVLDQSVTVGANAINGVSFSVDDDAELLDAARKAAVADALAKARLYADAAGVELGDIRRISENGGGMPPQFAKVTRMEMAMDSAPVPVEAGELNYSMTVTVEWELDQ